MNKIKKLFYVASLALAVLSFQVFGATFNIQKVNAESINTNFSSVSITNGDFNSNGTSTTLNSSPNGWTAKSITGVATKGVISTINTTTSPFADRYSNYKLPNATNPNSAHYGETNNNDNMILMINSTTDSGNSGVVQGFSSSDIALSAYTNYEISVSVKLLENAKATIVLKGLEDCELNTELSDNYLNITSSIAWTTYTFYVRTNFETPTVNLELYLGTLGYNQTSEESTGVALFDYVRVNKLSDKFLNTKLAGNADQFNFIGMKTYPNTSVYNLNFENGLDSWEKIGTYNTETHIAKASNINSNADTTLGNDQTTDNTQALLLSADEENSLYVGYKSPTLVIVKNAYYRISLNVKCEDIKGSAVAKVVETEYLKDVYSFSNYETKSTKLSISANTTNPLKNNYTTFEFYISGHELYDTEVQLELSLGDTDSTASGTVVFDSIVAELIPYSIYSSATTGSTSTTLNLTTITGTPTIANGYFNLGHSETAVPTYPYIPNDWAQNADKSNTNNTTFGIFNTADWTSELTNPQNANITYAGMTISVPNGTSNNILVLQNANPSYQLVESPTLSLSSKSYYTLSFNYQTRGTNVLNFRIIDDAGNVVYQDLGLTNSAWQYYKIAISTEYYTSTLTLQFELGTADAPKTGVVFLDNFQLVTESYTEDAFKTIVNNNENSLDFANGGFNLKGESIGSNLYQALMFTSSEISESINAGNGGITEKIIKNEPANVLTIITNGITDYSFTSKDSITLTKDSFYKFLVSIKTEYSVNPTKTKDSDFGSYFSLSGIEDSTIKNISSNGSFTEYAIYVKCDAESSVQVKFGFKSDSIDSLGQVFFSEYSYSEIDKSDYTSALASSTLLLVNNQGIEPDDEDEDATDSQGSVNLWIAISTIIMVIAMVIAIVGALLRKVEIKKFKVKRQVEYDRQATLVRDVAFAEAETRKNAEIKSLLTEKEQLKTYLNEIDEDNKKRLAEERKVSGKQITRKAEHEFRVYASHRQKIVKDMDKIDAKIKEAETPEYLMRIVKIVQNEKVKAIMDKDKETETTKPETDKID